MQADLELHDQQEQLKHNTSRVGLPRWSAICFVYVYLAYVLKSLQQHKRDS